MNITCCDVPSYLPTFPQTWRKELTSLLCEVINSKLEVDCQAVKDCETVTSVSNLSFSDNVLSFTYFDESGEGNYRSIDLSDLGTGIYEFKNGLIKDPTGIVKLGGLPLIENTTLALSTFNLDITGENIRFPTYLSTRTPDTENGTYLFTHTNGKLMLGSFAGQVINGLRYDNNYFKLGGNLIEPTIIGDTNTLSQLSDNNLLIKNHVGVGDLANSTEVSRFVVVHNAIPTQENIGAIYADKVILENEPTADSFGIVGIQSTRGSVDIDFTGVYNAAIDARFSYSSNTTDIAGNINGVVSNLNVVTSTNGEGGDIESFTAFRATKARQADPLVLTNKLYGGTIEKITGLHIEDLSTGASFSGATITESWGIYQEGVNDFNKFYGITGFGPFGLSDSSAQVNVSRVAQHNYKSIGLNSYVQLNQNRIVSIDSNVTTSIQGVVDLSFPSNETFTSSAFVSAIDAKVIYSSNTANITGKVASLTTDSLFYSGITSNGGGNFDKLIGLRVTRPLQLEPTILLDAKDYTGTIADTYGILIEQQSGGLRVGATQTRTWGIYQEGATDVNYFNGKMRFTSTSLPIYANNTAADSALQSGEMYRLTGDRTVYVKP